MTVLTGLRVVEISANGTAAYAAKHFADWGAEVVVIEPAGGTPLRSAPPYYEHDGEQRSATWAWLSRGKSAIGRQKGLTPAEAIECCLGADLVLVESELTEGVLGLQPSEVRSTFDGKTTCVLIVPFSTDGPYSSHQATDIGVLALGGWLGMVGDPDREPVRPGGEVLARTAGMFTAVAGIVGLRHVRRGGTPQHVELSSQAVAASVLTSPWMIKSMAGVEIGRFGRKGTKWAPGMTWPSGVMECSDGFVGCTPLTAMHWEMLCKMMEISDVLEEPGGREPAYRAAHGAELFERVKPLLQTKTRMEIVHEAQTWRLPAAAVQGVDERLQCPQLEATGFWDRAEIDGRSVKVPRVTSLFDSIRPVTRGPLREMDRVEPRANDRGAAPAEAPSRPFEGIRVLDLTHFWAGPHATMLLSALGADVIKVESVQRPDAYRFATFATPTEERWYEYGATWNDTNCGKRGITLNLGSPKGKALFDRLVPQADVVLSNFSNRVMPALGLTSERLLELNPRIIALTLPGYGPTGPWADWVGFGLAFEQLDVCASITGYPDREPRVMGGFSDPTAGMQAVMAIELALLEREKTGKGAIIDVPQSEALESLWAPEHIAVQHGAPVPTRESNKHSWMAPHNVYQVDGDDAWISIAVASDEEFAAMAGEIGLEGVLDDQRFSTVAGRKANEDALDELIAPLLRDRDGRALEQALQGRGVKACRVIEPALLISEDNLAHIEFFQSLERPYSGRHSYKTWPFRYSGIDTKHRLPPPTLGEHTREVLGELLGADDVELDGLEQDAVIGTAPLGF